MKQHTENGNKDNEGSSNDVHSKQWDDAEAAIICKKMLKS